MRTSEDSTEADPFGVSTSRGGAGGAGSNSDPYFVVRTQLLLAAFVALAVSLVVFFRSLDRSRQGVVIAIVLFGLGVIAFGLAGTVEQWCAPATAKFGVAQWGQHDFHRLSWSDCFGTR